MTRREWFATVFGVPIPGMNVPRLGVHIQGTLTTTDSERTEGYYALCATDGTCHPTDALGISCHPKSPISDDLWAMHGRRVQVSVFPL